jgi:myo-inositol-1(or 4)-monophosphatase
MLQTPLNELLKEVEKVAEKAGQFIHKESLHFKKNRIEIKGLNDLVSYVDRESEKLIIDDLKQLIPESGFIAEENSVSAKGSYNWIIDPLDGTTNFIHGIPAYAVSIALEHNNNILLGVVYEVNRQECFSAVIQQGAFLNGQRIHVSENKILKDSLIATGFPIYNFSKQEAYLNVLRELMQKTHGIRRIGAAAVDLCYLACGRVDAFFEYNLSPWDVAAGALIVREAGGTVTDFRGGDNWLFGKEIIAGNAYLKKEFSQLIQNHFCN